SRRLKSQPLSSPCLKPGASRSFSGEFDNQVLTRIKASERDREVWKRFGDTVGWRKNRDWLELWDINFSTLAPEGHLPWLSSTVRYGFNWVEWVCRDSLLSSGDF
ncbi:GUN4 domain-containing protein, partial [Microcoleus sp. T3_D1]